MLRHCPMFLLFVCEDISLADLEKLLIFYSLTYRLGNK